MANKVSLSLKFRERERGKDILIVLVEREGVDGLEGRGYWGPRLPSTLRSLSSLNVNY